MDTSKHRATTGPARGPTAVRHCLDANESELQATTRRMRHERRVERRCDIHRESIRCRYRSIPIVVAGAVLALMSIKP
ncbi:hypothetical protein [Burkholderia sp. 22313]|uniref:hypothetical protein n=1 Tax=Burkholderia sp. 22313 TaxID=3453908 RepID=UPI002B841DE9|nr:hypothetical protein [Burkholderia sp.]